MRGAFFTLNSVSQAANTDRFQMVAGVAAGLSPLNCLHNICVNETPRAQEMAFCEDMKFINY